MGNIGDELGTPLLGIFQRIRHFVERIDQRTHLVGGIGILRNTDGEIAPCKRTRCLGDFVQRLRHPFGIEVGKEQNSCKNNRSRH